MHHTTNTPPTSPHTHKKHKHALKRLMLLVASATLPYAIALSAQPMPPAHNQNVYQAVDELLKLKADSPAVKTIRKLWLDTPAADLAEAAILYGARILPHFDAGARLLDIAEAETDAPLSPRSYGALMQLGLAEERHSDVLGLLARLRAHAVDPSPTALRASMSAAAAIEDWGAVSRLFSELTGAGEPAMALEIFGAPEDVAAALERMGDDEAAETRLSPADAEALRLVLHAHCVRGDVYHAKKALGRARELEVPLAAGSLAELSRLALASLSPKNTVLLPRASDVVRSVSSWAEPRVFELQAAASRLSKAEAQLVGVVLCAALGAGGFWVLVGGGTPPAADPFDF